jgi:hypothetical protein
MKFTIRELLLITLIVALALAWWVDRRNSKITVSVFFQAEVGQDGRIERPLVNGLTVAQILVQTGAAKKYAQFEVEVLRPSPRGGYSTIPCELDSGAKQINPKNDFVLLPGDQVLVKDKSLSSTMSARIAPSSFRRSRLTPKQSSFGPPRQGIIAK